MCVKKQGIKKVRAFYDMNQRCSFYDKQDSDFGKSSLRKRPVADVIVKGMTLLS